MINRYEICIFLYVIIRWWALICSLCCSCSCRDNCKDDRWINMISKTNRGEGKIKIKCLLRLWLLISQLEVTGRPARLRFSSQFQINSKRKRYQSRALRGIVDEKRSLLFVWMQRTIISSLQVSSQFHLTLIRRTKMLKCLFSTPRRERLAGEIEPLMRFRWRIPESATHRLWTPVRIEKVEVNQRLIY